MLIEMRRYAVLPGQMDLMHARMRDMLLPLFREHSIPAPRAIWENRRGTSTLTWLVEWQNFEQRQEAWTRFAPVFVAARRKEATPEFVTRTTLTVIAPWPDSVMGFGPAPALCETVWHVQPNIGFGAAFMAACRETVFDRFRRLGATNVSGCNLVFGALPQAMVLLGWPDDATRAAGMAALARESLGSGLEETVLGKGSAFAGRGEWEDLDRAPYCDGSAQKIHRCER